MLKYTALELKAKVAHFLRYGEQCPMVAFEASSRLDAFKEGGASDVMAVDKQGRVLDIEVKLTLDDLRKDRRKPKHRWLGKRLEGTEPPLQRVLYPIHYFYFAVPYELANKAVDICVRLIPYAGVFGVRKDSVYLPYYVSRFRSPKLIPNPQISEERQARMSREMSASLVRLAMELAGVEIP